MEITQDSYKRHWDVYEPSTQKVGREWGELHPFFWSEHISLKVFDKV